MAMAWNFQVRDCGNRESGGLEVLIAFKSHQPIIPPLMAVLPADRIILADGPAQSQRQGRVHCEGELDRRGEHLPMDTIEDHCVSLEEIPHGHCGPVGMLKVRTELGSPSRNAANTGIRVDIRRQLIAPYRAEFYFVHRWLSPEVMDSCGSGSGSGTVSEPMRAWASLSVFFH